LKFNYFCSFGQNHMKLRQPWFQGKYSTVTIGQDPNL